MSKSKVDMTLRQEEGYTCSGKTESGVFIPNTIRREAIKAKRFIQEHPALCSCNQGFNELFYSIQEVCKRGITELGPITVWNTPANRKKFAKDFNKRFSKEELGKNPTCYIYKKYEEVYGEPWAFDHVEYWWETTFNVYFGSVERDSVEWMDVKKWQSYAHGEGGALTIEEAYINAAKFAKETLGDFGYNSFLTKEEKENHDKQDCFFFKKSNKKIIGLSGKEESCREMIQNKKYLKVHDGMHNRRWLKWFVETPYCKKNWKKLFKEIVSVQPPNGLEPLDENL